MRRLTALLVLVLVLVSALSAAAKLELAEMTTRGAIQDATARGDLEEAQKYLYMAYSIYAPEKLPAEYRGGRIDKCGVPTIEAIDDALPTLPEAVANEIRGLRVRPSCQTYMDTEHFRIHYDTSGTHAILSTDYLNAIATALENCWDEEIDVLGFRQPPSDGSDADGGGGSAHYDFYVQSLSGVYGYCQPTFYAPGGPANDATSFCVIDNDYAGFGYVDPTDPMKVTVAHEFCHGLQAAHDVNEELWYKECTSVWVEEMVYDEINDYTQYCSSFFSSLWRPLEYDDSNVRIYGSFVWNMFLTENISPSVVVDNWWQMEVSGEYTAMNAVLTTYGTSLEEQFHEFSIWNFFTNARNDGAHYEEAAYLPLASFQRTFGMYPLTDVGPYTATRPDHMGSNYIKFSNPGNTWTGLHLSFDGPALYELPYWADVCVREDQVGVGHTSHLGEITLNPWGNGDMTVADWDLMDYACLIVTNGCTTTDDMDYLFSAEQVDTGVEVGSHIFAMKPASPNPFTAQTSIAYTVPNGGGAVEMTIYDVNGRAVRTLVDEQMMPGDRLAYWDGLDNNGEKVASGVYFARLNVDGLTACGKLVVLK